MNVLAGDIGGTNSRLAIYDIGPDGLRLRTNRTYPSADFGCAEEVVDQFLRSCNSSCEVVCLGLPGPVSRETEVRLTNLPWKVNRERIRLMTGAEQVAFINDVEASALGLEGLLAGDADCLHEGRANPVGNRAVISVGTGLGVGGLTADGSAFATEAGHASFAPRVDVDFGLLRALANEFGHVSWERLVSGPGLARIHAHVTDSNASDHDPREIVARSATDPGCRRSVAVFSRLLGSAVGSIALTLMATGGVYLCGGVTAPIVDRTGFEKIFESFVDKGRMRCVLERIPIYLVRDGDLALQGAARNALRLLNGSRGRVMGIFECGENPGSADRLRP